MKSRAVAVWVWLCLCGHLFGGGERALAQAKPAKPAPTAAAPSPTETQAREAFERGRIHYDNGDFPRAAAAFEDAYRLSGRDGLLYNLYLAYRDANNQEKAAEALRGYLTKVEAIENRPQLEARLKALEDGIAQRKAAEAAEAAERDRLAREQAEREANAQKQAAAQSAPAAAPVNKHWWVPGVAVMGAGAALMLGSIGTGVASNSKADKLEKECMDGICDPSFKSTGDSGKTLAVVTDVLLFGGLATAVVGGVLLLLKKPKKAASAQDKPQAHVSCSRAGCVGSMSLRF
jgi:tetratricopeptide (TPR) repeat protein